MNTERILQIEKLKRQKEVLEARIQKAEALHQEKQRKEETRRKILIGAYFLDKLRKEDGLDSIKPALDVFLTRSSDRLLFGLPTMAIDNKNDTD